MPVDYGGSPTKLQPRGPSGGRHGHVDGGPVTSRAARRMALSDRVPDSDRSLRRRRWMALAQAGDHEAYRAVLDDVSTMLKGFLRRRLADPDDAADVLQEILMTVHRARHTYDAGRPFEPWLFAIVNHALIDHLRRRRRMAPVVILSHDDLPETAAPEEIGPSEMLEHALATLPPTQREAFEMLKLEGLSVAAAAARVGASPAALRVRAHRAYKAIRALLQR